MLADMSENSACKFSTSTFCSDVRTDFSHLNFCTFPSVHNQFSGQFFRDFESVLAAHKFLCATEVDFLDYYRFLESETRVCHTQDWGDFSYLRDPIALIDGDHFLVYLGLLFLLKHLAEGRY